MQIARWSATALFIVCVPIFLLLSNVRIAATEPRVYGYSFAHYDVSAITGVDRPQLDAAARDIVLYFEDSRPLLTTRATIGGQDQPLFNTREILHMRDVKALFGHVFLIQEIAFAYLVSYIVAVFLWARERSLFRLSQQLIVAGGLTSALLAVGAFAALVGFDRLFIEFHMLAFANDFWELDPARDHLIQMFPGDFWFAVTLAVGVATIMEGALVTLAGFGLRSWLMCPAAPAGIERAATATEASSSP